MKDGRKITLDEALQLFRQMYPGCGEGTPKKVDVASIDWPFPFAKTYRDGKCMLSIVTCPVLGTSLPQVVNLIYQNFPEHTKEIDAAIYEWDQTTPFTLHMKEYFYK